MKDFAILLLGIVLGAIAGHFLWPQGPSATPPIEPTIAARPLEKAPAPEVMKPIAATAPVPAASAAATTTATAAPAVAATPAAEASPQSQRMEITFSSEVMDEMETNMGLLRQQVHLRKNPKGWSVVEIAETSVFYRTGLLRGDIVTRESIESFRTRDPRVYTRLVNLFDTLSR